MGCTGKHVIGGEAFQTVGFSPLALKEGACRATCRAEKLVIHPPERGWKQKRKKGRANIDSNMSIIYLFNLIHHLNFTKGYFHCLKRNSSCLYLTNTFLTFLFYLTILIIQVSP